MVFEINVLINQNDDAIPYEFEVDEEEVKELLVGYVHRDDPSMYTALDDDTLADYVEENFEKLVEDYYDQLVEAFYDRAVEQYNDTAEYNRDPYAYYGVSRSDFY